jgi:hypothetical protein
MTMYQVHGEVPRKRHTQYWHDGKLLTEEVIGLEGFSGAWTPFEYFIGSWTGEESASFGAGRGERVYRFILQGRYLISQNVSRFPPQESRPQGETHEDWTIFSYDSVRKTYIIRQLID